MAIVQLTLQVKSNLRLLVQSQEHEDLFYGSDPTLPNLVEYHRVTFERYYRLPQELEEFRARLMSEARGNESLKSQLAEKEMFNPWLITDFDETMPDEARHFRDVKYR